MDWTALFVPQTSLAELVVRGTVMYLALFALLRFVIGRRVGALGMTDLLVIVIIADAAQNGMAGEYKSITEGLTLCATIMFWSYLFDWLSFRFAWFRKLAEPTALPLIQDGVMNRNHMRRELVTRDELVSQLREHGIESVGEVKAAFLEPDGQISVIKRSGETDAKPARRRRNAL